MYTKIGWEKPGLVADPAYQPVVDSPVGAYQVYAHLLPQDYNYLHQNDYKFPDPAHHLNFPVDNIIVNDNCNPEDIHKLPSKVLVSLLYKFIVLTYTVAFTMIMPLVYAEDLIYVL